MLDIQHYNATIEHVPGVLNTPAGVFSRLVEKEHGTSVCHIMVLKFTARDNKNSTSGYLHTAVWIAP